MEDIALEPFLSIAEKAPATGRAHVINRGRNRRQHLGSADGVELVLGDFGEVDLMVEEVEVEFLFAQPPVSGISPGAERYDLRLAARVGRDERLNEFIDDGGPDICA